MQPASPGARQAASAAGAPGGASAARWSVMRRLFLSLVFFSFTAALAGGVIRLVEVDEMGEVAFSPQFDSTALSWWRTRAESLVDRSGSLPSTSDLLAR